MKFKSTFILLSLLVAEPSMSLAADRGGAIDRLPVVSRVPLGVPRYEKVDIYGCAMKHGFSQKVSCEAPEFIPDWTGSLNSPEEFGWFSVIDSNGDSDGSMGIWQWREDAGCAWYNYSYTAYGDQVDDWLVTPGLNLKAGKQYSLKFYATNRSTFYDDKMEVMIGKLPEADSLTTPLIESFSLASNGWLEHGEDFTVAEDGCYYIGFHLTEAGYMSSVFLDEVSVTCIPMEASPSGVTDLNVIPDAGGEVSATISFILPSSKVDGTQLMELEGVKIRNGYFEIADIKGVSPGEHVEYNTDNLGAGGFYTFNVVAYNEVDEGIISAETVYVGLDVPQTPQNVILHDMQDHMTVTCDAIESAHGGVYFPEEVDFNVYTIERDEYGFPIVGELVSSVRGTNSLDVAMRTDTGEQTLLSYVTNASNAAGNSPNYYQTNSIVLGSSYPIPFEETFDNGQTSFFWMNQVKSTGFGQTGVYSTPLNGFDSRPGCMLLSAINAGDCVAIYTGKISMEGSESPLYTFSVNNASSTEGTLEVIILDANGEEHMLATCPVSDFEKNVWKTLSYDLSEWKNESYVNVGIRYIVDERDNGNQIYFDHFYVGDLPSADASTEIFVPRQVERGGYGTVTVRINNLGRNLIDSCKVLLTANNKVIADQEMECSIPPMGSATANFEYMCLPIEVSDIIAFEATVIASGDENPINNKSQANTEVVNPDLAPASALTVTENEEGLELRWNAAGALAPKTDRFETYTPWNYDDIWGYVEPNPGDWTMIDVDGGSTGGFTDALYYGAQGQPFAFTVFNPYNYTGYGQSLFSVISEEVGASFIPHSGEQYLAGVYSADTYWDGDQYVGVIKDADNWMVSPELTGDAQTIHFWVNNFKGLSGNGNVIDHVETYQVLYSTGGKEVEDFILIGDNLKAAGGMWQPVEIELPEGAKYFAIRHCSSYDAETGTPFILMIDDVVYYVANKEVKGYRVYCDGEEIAMTDAETTNLIDSVSSQDEEHLYQVTVLYADGTESPAVSVLYKLTGISATEDCNDHVYDIFTTSGVMVRHGVATANDLPAGLYITSDGKKIVVK